MPRPARGRQNAVGRALTGKKPGEVAILKPTRRVTRKSGKELIKTEFAVEASGALFVEVDARRYVRELQLALADHCGDSLKRQVSPETGRPIRPPDEVQKNSELRRAFGSVKSNPETLMTSSDMAETWYVGKVTGSHLKAQGIVRPTIKGYKLQWVNYYLGAAIAVDTQHGNVVALKRTDPPIDLQSTEGRAAQVITDTVSDLATRSMGTKVRTPKTVRCGATDRRRR